MVQKTHFENACRLWVR